MDDTDSLMRLLVGGVFIVYGIVTLRRQKARVGFGRNGSFLPITIYGFGAVFLGICLIIGGTLFGLSFVFYRLNDLLSFSFFLEIPAIGILIMFIGIIVSPILSSSSNKNQQDKDKHPLTWMDDISNQSIIDDNILDDIDENHSFH